MPKIDNSLPPIANTDSSAEISDLQKSSLVRADSQASMMLSNSGSVNSLVDEIDISSAAQPEEIEPARNDRPLKTSALEGVLSSPMNLLSNLNMSVRASVRDVAEIANFVATSKVGEEIALPKSIADFVKLGFSDIKIAMKNASVSLRAEQALLIAHPMVAATESGNLFNGQFKIAAPHIVALYKFDEPKDLTLLFLVRHEASIGVSKEIEGLTGASGGFLADEFGPSIVISMDKVSKRIGQDVEDDNQSGVPEFRLSNENKIHIKSKGLIKQTHRGHAVTVGHNNGIAHKPYGLETFSNRSFDRAENASLGRKALVVTGIAAEKALGTAMGAAVYAATQAAPFSNIANTNPLAYVAAQEIANLGTSIAAYVGTFTVQAVRELVDTLIPPDSRGTVSLLTADPLIWNSERINIGTFGENDDKKVQFGGFGIAKLQFRLPLSTGWNRPVEGLRSSVINRDIEIANKQMTELTLLKNKIGTESDTLHSKETQLNALSASLPGSKDAIANIADHYLDAKNIVQNKLGEIEINMSIVEIATMNIKNYENELQDHESGSVLHNDMSELLSNERHVLKDAQDIVQNTAGIEALQEKDREIELILLGDPANDILGVLKLHENVEQAIGQVSSLRDDIQNIKSKRSDSVDKDESSVREKLSDLLETKKKIDTEKSRLEPYSKFRSDRMSALATEHNESKTNSRVDKFRKDTMDKMGISNTAENPRQS